MHGGVGSGLGPNAGPAAMRFPKLRRVLAVLGAAGATAIAYRVVFVYDLTPDPCAVVQHVAVVTSAAAPPRDEPGTARRPVRVLSYNIEGHAALLRADHLAGIARVIREQGADVVGLQEVHRGTWQSRFRDQTVELARLTGMHLSFGPSFRSLGGEFGNAILTRGSVGEVEVVRLPSFGEPRSLLRARVEVDGTDFDFMVTHLAAWGALNRRTRTKQALCLAQQLRAASRRFVLCGDFNATPASAELAALLGGDLVRLCGLATEPTYPMLGQRIDYILAGPGWEVGPAAVVKGGPSDHWPILAELTPLPAKE